ncbi:MAG: hypothetical protein R2698_08880 [Microthrixaceae bacterium]
MTLEPAFGSNGVAAVTRRITLRDLCGVRSGDKGDLSDLTLFADDDEAYAVIVDQVDVERVTAHFSGLVSGEVVRYEVPNVRALKFVMSGALGGGGPRSLRSDNLGKTLGGALLRMEIDVPVAVADGSARLGRRAPLPGSR